MISFENSLWLVDRGIAFWLLYLYVGNIEIWKKRWNQIERKRGEKEKFNVEKFDEGGKAFQVEFVVANNN